MTVSFIGGGNWRKPRTCYKLVNNLRVKIRIMVLNAIFNNISAISGWSVLLMEENGIPRENLRPSGSHRRWIIEAEPIIDLDDQFTR